MVEAKKLRSISSFCSLVAVRVSEQVNVPMYTLGSKYGFSISERRKRNTCLSLEITTQTV